MTEDEAWQAYVVACDEMSQHKSICSVCLEAWTCVRVNDCSEYKKMNESIDLLLEMWLEL